MLQYWRLSEHVEKYVYYVNIIDKNKIYFYHWQRL